MSTNAFSPRKTTPAKGDTFFDFYKTKKSGGKSPCVTGKETQIPTVLNNCVGYVWGRFNEIACTLNGDSDFKYYIAGNAKDIYPKAEAKKSTTWAVGSEPQLGAIVCWDGGKKGAEKTYGHVAIVEEIIDNNTAKISHSGYSSFTLRYNTLVRDGDGWYASSSEQRWLSAKGNNSYKYYFKGFVYNPAVTPSTQVGESPSSPVTPSPGQSQGSWNATPTVSTNAPVVSANTLPEDKSAEIREKARIEAEEAAKAVENARAEAGAAAEGAISKYKNEFKELFSIPSQDIITTNGNSSITVNDTSAVNLLESTERTSKLLSSPALVEVPFISIKIGDTVFGTYKENAKTKNLSAPNHVDSIQITKINGQLNVYNFTLKHIIFAGEDPNFIDKVFSSISDTRTVTISYGDMSMPDLIFRDETAIITKVTSKVDFSSSMVTYTVRAVSDQLQLKTIIKTYEQESGVKPSSIIDRLINTQSSGLQTFFPGLKKAMQKYSLFPTDDMPVDIEKRSNISTLDYLNFLVSCMKPANGSKNSVAANGKYIMYIEPDIHNEFGGAYFRIVKVAGDEYTATKDIADSAYSCYEVDVGFPGNEMISNFSVVNDDEWSLLYKYSEKIDHNPYVYKLNDDGEQIAVYSPGLTTSAEQYRTTNAQKSWWTDVTQFPIQANLTMRCILQPIMLASYIRVNSFFYGIKHISSGLYIVTKQVDTINSSGCKTELTLLRILGDNEK